MAGSSGFKCLIICIFLGSGIAIGEVEKGFLEAVQLAMSRFQYVALTPAAWKYPCLLPSPYAPLVVHVDHGILQIPEGLENVSVAALMFTGSVIPHIKTIIGTPNGDMLPTTTFMVVDNGTLVLNEALDYSAQKDKSFMMTLKLGKNAEKVVIFQIKRRIEDNTSVTSPEAVNGQRPENPHEKLQFNTWIMKITENHYNSSPIHQAVDGTNSGGEICYCMAEGDVDNFILSGDTLSNKHLFDRETKDRYQVIISASKNCPSYNEDGACKVKTPFMPENRSFLIANVTVTDDNDEIPYFTRNYYGASYYSNDDSYEDEIVIQAHDLDLDEVITYEIYNNEVKYHGATTLSVKVVQYADIFSSLLKSAILHLAPPNWTTNSSHIPGRHLYCYQLLDHTWTKQNRFTMLSRDNIGVVNVDNEWWWLRDYQYYSFRVVAYDKVGHASNLTTVKVFKYERENVLQLCYVVPPETINCSIQKMDKVTDILSEVFQHTCVVRQRKPKAAPRASGLLFFINTDANEIIDNNVIMAKHADAKVAQDLKDRFAQENLIFKSLSVF